jgi:succinate-semialdehyde dehydrogenase/glutarate-semialdehyde dehydrogenase
MPTGEGGEDGVQARLNNAGQVCTAAKRFILHEKIADRS